MPQTIYTHQLQGSNIRLLQLLPGYTKDILKCRLLEVSLEDKPSYEAISYVWGDRNVTESIVCNGQPMNITVNLAQALRQFRLKPASSQGEEDSALGMDNLVLKEGCTPSRMPPAGSVRTLWADAICIDQTNTGERNHQVRLMKNVFSSASRVIVWLGCDYPVEISHAVDIIKYIHANRSKHASEGPNRITHATVKEYMSMKEIEMPWWTFCERYFTSPWFQRVW